MDTVNRPHHRSRNMNRITFSLEHSTNNREGFKRRIRFFPFFLLPGFLHEPKPCTADIPFFPSKNEGRDRIKIAGAISRAHDTGENAAEALIMADTRRGSRYHVLPLNFQDSHYANVPPITDPPRRLLPPCTFSQSLPIGIMQTVDAKISNISTHATVDRKEGRKEGNIVDIRSWAKYSLRRQVTSLAREREREGRQVFWSRVNEPVLRINLTILRLRMGQMKESCCIEQGSFAPLKRLQRPIGIFNRVLGGMGEETLFSIPWRGQTLSRSLSLWGSARSERLAIRCPL